MAAGGRRLTFGAWRRAATRTSGDAGVLVFAGGLEEDPDEAFSADATSGDLVFRNGPYVRTAEFVGGMTIVEVADEQAARMWAGKVAVACGWPQEVREFKGWE